MSASMLCGDEVGAIVADIGGSTCKFGSAGQDAPPHVFRSYIREVDDGTLQKSKDNAVGDSALRFVRDNAVIVNPFAGGG